MSEKKFSWLDLIGIVLIGLLIASLFKSGSNVSSDGVSHIGVHSGAREMIQNWTMSIMKCVPYMMLTIMVIIGITVGCDIYEDWKNEKLSIKQLVGHVMFLTVTEVIVYLMYQHSLSLEMSPYVDGLSQVSVGILYFGVI